MKAAFVTTLVLFTACAPKAQEVPLDRFPVYLKPPAGAKVLTASGSTYEMGVAYEIEVPYPASEFIEAVKSRVGREWKPLSDDLMNPGVVSTSFVRGWTEFGDMTTHPNSAVHHWLMEWENGAGDFLLYDLRYRTVGPFNIDRLPSKPDNHRLMVEAEFWSNAAKQAALKDLAKRRGRL